MSTPGLQCVGTTGHFPEPMYVSLNNRLVSINSIFEQINVYKSRFAGKFQQPLRKTDLCDTAVSIGFRIMAIRDYKVPSDEQQFALSKILDPPTANMVSTVTLHDTDGDSEERRAKIPCTHGPAANVSSNLISRETSEEYPVSLQLSGTFQNCTFNLSFFGKKWNNLTFWLLKYLISISH